VLGDEHDHVLGTALALARRAVEIGHARAAEQRPLRGPPVGDPLHVALELAAVELLLRHSSADDGAPGVRRAIRDGRA
jgi:hypothetical protein